MFYSLNLDEIKSNLNKIIGENYYYTFKILTIDICIDLEKVGKGFEPLYIRYLNP